MYTVEFHVPEFDPNEEASIQVEKWLVEEGQAISEDQELVEIGTEKVVLAVPALVDGRLKRILVGEGEEVGRGQAIALLETPYLLPKDAGTPQNYFRSALAEFGDSLAVFEGFTSGHLAAVLSGSQAECVQFKGGLVANSSALILRKLGLNAGEEVGAEEKACLMAKWVRREMGSEAGLANCASDDPKVIWVGFANAHGSSARRMVLTHGWEQNIRLATNATLAYALEKLQLD